MHLEFNRIERQALPLQHTAAADRAVQKPGEATADVLAANTTHPSQMSSVAVLRPPPKVAWPVSEAVLRELTGTPTIDALNQAALALDWNAIARSRHASAWVATFSTTHLDKLSAANQAWLAVRWMQLAHRALAEGACTILLRCSGDALRALKESIDALTQGALTQFVWSPICAPWRESLLQHFQRDCVHLPGLQIFSDIDNTWIPSRDPGFPKNCGPYPGAPALYAALVGGPEKLVTDLIFLSARPENFKQVKQNTYATLEALGYRSHVIFGSFRYCIPRPWFKPLNPLGAKKAENYRRWVSVHPEHLSLFFGDSGEADIDAGLQMLKDEPDHLAAIFIHDLGNLTPAVRAAYEREGVMFYKTMVGAAVRAQERGLISSEQMISVTSAAMEDFERIDFVTPLQRRARLMELQQDIALATLSATSRLEMAAARCPRRSLSQHS